MWCSSVRSRTAVPGARHAALRAGPALDAVEVAAVRVHAAPIGIMRAAGTVSLVEQFGRQGGHRVNPQDLRDLLLVPCHSARQAAPLDQLADIILPLRAVIRHSLMMHVSPVARPKRNDTAPSLYRSAEVSFCLHSGGRFSSTLDWSWEFSRPNRRRVASFRCSATFRSRVHLRVRRSATRPQPQSSSSTTPFGACAIGHTRTSNQQRRVRPCFHDTPKCRPRRKTSVINKSAHTPRGETKGTRDPAHFATGTLTGLWFEQTGPNQPFRDFYADWVARRLWGLLWGQPPATVRISEQP